MDYNKKTAVFFSFFPVFLFFYVFFVFLKVGTPFAIYRCNKG